jgi:hypothetical protein
MHALPHLHFYEEVDIISIDIKGKTLEMQNYISSNALEHLTFECTFIIEINTIEKEKGYLVFYEILQYMPFLGLLYKDGHH